MNDNSPRCPEPGCGGPMIERVHHDGVTTSVCYWVLIRGGHAPLPRRVSMEPKQDRWDRENDEHIRDVGERCRSGGEV